MLFRSERVDHPTQKPLELIQRMILASCPNGGVVLDPFMGSGTTAVAALRLGRRFVGFEINPRYVAIARARLDAEMEMANPICSRVGQSSKEAVV